MKKSIRKILRNSTLIFIGLIFVSTSFPFLAFANVTSTASCSSSADVVAGQQVTWEANISGTAGDYTYSWSGTESLTGSDPVVDFTYQTDGQKSANLNVQVSVPSGTASVSCTISKTLGPVPQNNTKPVITLVGDNPMSITQGDTFTDPGATADDAEDGDITPDIVVSGTVDATTVGSYDLDYDVSDSEGLPADTVTRVVNVTSGGGGGDNPATCSITKPFNITTLDSVTFISQVTGSPAPLTYSWSGDDGLSGNTENVTYSYPTVGTKSVTLNVETASGPNSSVSCDDIVLQENPVNSAPQVDLKGNGSNGPLSLNDGDNLDLSWTIIGNADACIASGDWSGNKNVSGGSENAGALNTGAYTYDIECGNQHGTTTDSVTVGVSGGGGGSDPVVDLKGNGSDGPLTLSDGGILDLDWTASNANVCIASGDWIGNKAETGGTENIGALSIGLYTYDIECGNSNGTTTDSVSVEVVSTVNSAPIVDLKGNGSDGPLSLDEGNNLDLSWTIIGNADSCIANGEWSGNKSTTNGSENIGSLNEGNYNYSIECSNIHGTTTDSVSVEVSGGGGGGGGGSSLRITNEEVSEIVPGTAFVTWDTNRDATRRVVYGTESVSRVDRNDSNYGYQNTSVLIENPELRDHAMAITGLEPNTTYYFRPISTRGSKTAIGDELVLNPEEIVVGSCVYLFDFLKFGENNDPAEVTKLQIFLRDLEGFDNLEVNGVFDEATFDAVHEFQKRYDNDILNPWGYGDNESTGYVYILTKKKVNEIYCERAFPLNTQEESEIASYRVFLASLEQQGLSEDEFISPEDQTPLEDIIDQEGGIIDQGLIGQAESGDGTGATQNTGNLAGVASAITALPEDATEALVQIAVLVLALALIYVVVAIVFDDNNYKGHSKRTIIRWKIMSYIAGLIVAGIISAIAKIYNLIIPFAIIIVLLVLWLLWITFFQKEEILEDEIEF